MKNSQARNIPPKNVPHRDAKGRHIHYCMTEKEHCSAWGAFGFYHGKLWLCGKHKDDAERIVLPDVSRETTGIKTPPSVQGRLF